MCDGKAPGGCWVICISPIPTSVPVKALPAKFILADSLILLTRHLPSGKRSEGFPTPFRGKLRFPIGKSVVKRIRFPAKTYFAGSPLTETSITKALHAGGTLPGRYMPTAFFFSKTGAVKKALYMSKVYSHFHVKKGEDHSFDRKGLSRTLTLTLTPSKV